MSNSRVILITGVDGTLGSATAVAFSARGDKVIALGRRTEAPLWLPENASYYSVDIRDEKRLTEIMALHHVEVVFHFASLKNVGEAERLPMEYCSVNVDGTHAVLSAMKSAGVPHIIFASTWAVYAPLEPVARYDESSVVAPVSTYAITKVLGERFVRECAENGSVPRYHILRYANLVGPSPSVSGVSTFLDIAINAAREHKAITLQGEDHPTPDGTMARDFIDIRDVVQLHLLLPDAPSGVFNVGSGTATTLKHVISVVEQVATASIETKITTASPGALSSVAVISDHVRKALSWEPKFSLRDSIETLFDGSK